MSYMKIRPKPVSKICETAPILLIPPSIVLVPTRPVQNFVPPQPVSNSATTTNTRKTFDCNYCDGVYSQKSNLKRHILKKHPDKVVKANKKFKCSKCDRSFDTLISLGSHKRKKHGLYSGNRKWLTCPICSCPSLNLKRLCCHVTEEHNIEISRDTLEFSNQKEFLHWKNTEELESKSLYVKRVSSKFTTKNSETLTDYYHCNRSGFYRGSSNNIYRLKSQGSSKIDGFCTSHLKVKILQGGKHCVQYVKTHVGHSKDLMHLRLSRVQKDELASKIRNGIPFDEILEEVKSTSTTPISRLHLLTKADLHNIRKEYGLSNRVSDGLVRKSRREKAQKKMLELEERHQTSLSLSHESVIKFQSGFIVPSSTDDNEMYVVELNKSDCNCSLRCKHCSVCVHNFSCTCIDANIKGNMCEHIHLVCRIDNISEETEEMPSV